MKEWYVSDVTKAGGNMTCISLHLITTTVCSKRLVKLRKMRSRRKISLWWWWHTVNIESKKREKRNRELCIRILNFFFTPQQLGVRAGGQRSERVSVKSKIWKEWAEWKDMDSRAHSSFSLSVRNKGKEEWKKEQQNDTRREEEIRWLEVKGGLWGIKQPRQGY